MHTPERTARYENLVALSAKQAMAGRAPFASAVSATVEIFTAPPASWSHKKRGEALAGAIRPTTKPDLDNVLKSIADACNGIVFIDDKQLVSVSIWKRYSDIPGAHVSVEALA